MKDKLELLAHTKPLSDPLRIITILLFVSGSAFGVLGALAMLPAGILGALIPLSMGLMLVSFAFLIGSLDKPNAIYLRAFRTDKSTYKLRAELAAILGRGFRLCGIRPPRQKTSIFMRFMMPGLMAFRYAGSKFMELEAGDDWMARLWKTYQGIRLVFIDVRETTPHVHNEIQMTLETMGVKRCIFIVDPAKPDDEWRAIIESVAGPDYNPANFQFLHAGLEGAQWERMAAELRAMVANLPAGVLGKTEQGRQFVLDNVSEENLRRTWRHSTMVVLSAITALAFSMSLGLIQHGGIGELVDVVLGLITITMFARALVLAAMRIKRLAHAGHRADSVRATVLLVIISLPFLFIVVLPLPAIPVFLKARRRADETAAVESLRTLNYAEVAYQQTYPEDGYTCRLSDLGGDPATGAPTPQAAQIIEADLASGRKAGYTFALSNCATSGAEGHPIVTSFQLTAVPTAGKFTGYCSDDSGIIRMDPKGGTNCTESLPDDMTP